MTTDTNGEFEQKIPNVLSAYQVVLKNQGNVIVTHMRGSRNVTQRAKIGKKTWSPYVKKLVLLVVPKPVFTRSNNIKMFLNWMLQPEIMMSILLYAPGPLSFPIFICLNLKGLFSPNFSLILDIVNKSKLCLDVPVGVVGVSSPCPYNESD